MKNRVLVFLFVELCVAGLPALKAQTTLSGNHVIDGDLAVGTSLNGSRVSINGETGNNAAPGLSLIGDGVVSFEGTIGPGGAPSIQGGATMIWVPRKAAFRAGYLDAESDSLNIGNYSFGAGYNPRAEGERSVAFGISLALGYGSFAAGEQGSFAEGDYSFAIGGGYAGGLRSISFGGYSGGVDSISGPNSGAIAQNSAAFGGGNAQGRMSTALSMGYSGGETSVGMAYGLAGGDCSIAMSLGMAVGSYSFAFGPGSVAYYQSFVIGRFNKSDDTIGFTEWIASDPLFVVGNGTGNDADPIDVRERNAFVIYKDGKIKMERQGDILMGEFGNPE